MARNPSTVQIREITLNDYAAKVAEANDHWWRDLETGEYVDRNIGEMLMLIVSEVAEAMEGDRKQLMDDKVPHRTMFEVELVDVLIRVFDLAGHLGLDLDGAFRDKMEYNRTREDHHPLNRLQPGGTRY